MPLDAKNHLRGQLLQIGKSACGPSVQLAPMTWTFLFSIARRHPKGEHAP